MISEILTRFRFLIFRKRRSELDEEIEFHLEQAIATRIAAGMDPAEARRQALIEFGGIEPAQEHCERQRPGWWIGTVMQDVHYTFRGFGRESAVYHQCAGHSGTWHWRDDSRVQRCRSHLVSAVALCIQVELCRWDSCTHWSGRSL